MHSYKPQTQPRSSNYPQILVLLQCSSYLHRPSSDQTSSLDQGSKTLPQAPSSSPPRSHYHMSVYQSSLLSITQASNNLRPTNPLPHRLRNSIRVIVLNISPHPLQIRQIERRQQALTARTIMVAAKKQHLLLAHEVTCCSVIWPRAGKDLRPVELW